MNYYVYVPYYPLMHTYHPTNHKCKNSYPVDIYYTHPTYFDYRFYAVPTYHETEYQMGRRIVRKEKGGPDFEAPSYRNSDLETPSSHDPDFEAPSYRNSDLETPSSHDPDFETPSYRNSDLETPSSHDPDFETPSYHNSDLETPSSHDLDFEAPSYRNSDLETPSSHDP
ncbi:MSCRAMM family adhesin SdrC, partial [Priestia megaterium]|nr:MSCRAMM family adhesin SdrC [Priestia megaterium]